MEPHHWLIAGGLTLGIAFGILAQYSRFCIVAAVGNYMLMRDKRQLDAYLAALAVAVAGTAALELGNWVGIADSGFRRPAVNWLGAMGGGVLFGVGAILAGGCASRTLVRCAEGNIGGLVTLLAFALAGMATLFGVLDPLRGWLSSNSVVRLGSDDSALATLLAVPSWVVPLVMVALCVGLILLHARRQPNWRLVAFGAGIGLIIALGWWVTGVLGYDEFEEVAPSSLAVAGPLARGAVYLAMGQPTGNLFALCLVPGMLLGALGSALLTGNFRWSAPAGDRVGAYLAGGILMGIGAVLAGGCNVGQGLSGIATTSLSSFLAVAGILLGMLGGLRWLERQGA
jgi:uncharacterized membrane protein YedE/YeeE